MNELDYMLERNTIERAILLNDDSCLLENGLLLENAKFSFLPKFKTFCDKYPEMKKHASVMAEAEVLLKLTSSGEKPNDVKSVFLKIVRLILRIDGILSGLGSAIMLPFLLLVAPVIPYLVVRVRKWLVETADIAIAKHQSKVMITKLTKTMNKLESETAKAKYAAIIKKIETNLQNINNESTSIFDLDLFS